MVREFICSLANNLGTSKGYPQSSDNLNDPVRMVVPLCNQTTKG